MGRKFVRVTIIRSRFRNGGDDICFPKFQKVEEFYDKISELGDVDKTVSR